MASCPPLFENWQFVKNDLVIIGAALEAYQERGGSYPADDFYDLASTEEE